MNLKNLNNEQKIRIEKIIENCKPNKYLRELWDVEQWLRSIDQ